MSTLGRRRLNGWKGSRRWRLLSAFLPFTILFFGGLAAPCAPPVPQDTAATRAISAAEFSRLIRELSEKEGYFFSDNFISNESSYLHVVDKLKQLGVSGGAYVGVGPEQNFTYIAKIRPEIAFIVDIRRQAIIQHLLYKAIFHLANDRAHFLSLLFSKPLRGAQAPTRNASLDRLLEYFSQTPASREAFEQNLAKIQNKIQRDFEVPLTPDDLETLGYLYGAFAYASLDISFRLGRRYSPWGWWSLFPTLKDLMLAEDLNGKKGNFLAREEDYDFVRRLHRLNRIIPIVGDFAGSKALAAIADYLRENHYTVSAYYTSNVEEYLFDAEVFERYTKNVRRLPITHKSVFIRSVRVAWVPHPMQVPGHRMIMLLQNIAVFLKDSDQGRYPNYRRLITTHPIAPQEP